MMEPPSLPIRVINESYPILVCSSWAAVPPGKTSDGLILRSWVARGLSLSIVWAGITNFTISLPSLPSLSPLWSKSSICSNYLGLGWSGLTITIICCLPAFQSEPNMINETAARMFSKNLDSTPLTLQTLHPGQDRYYWANRWLSWSQMGILKNYNHLFYSVDNSWEINIQDKTLWCSSYHISKQATRHRNTTRCS